MTLELPKLEELNQADIDALVEVLASTQQELQRLLADRNALLEVLKMLVLATKEVSVGHYNEEEHDIALSKARAAIKAVEQK